MKIKVTKSTGAVEDFSLAKLKKALRKAGATKGQAREITERIVHESEPFTSTKEIYRLALKYLRNLNYTSGLRFALKKAILQLGPSGYPFEKYFAEVMKNYGYKVQVGGILKGKCVSHEVDVFAIRTDAVVVIECKFHNSADRLSDLKVAMYVDSRFRDLQPVMAERHPEKVYAGWLVTNTHCTGDAMDYAGCAGFKVVSWKHPKNGSLKNLIEDQRLYPVTIISGIKAGLAQKLIDQNVILLRDLVKIDVSRLQSMLSLPRSKATALKKQVDALCCR
ncbi:MAG: ATPase [bacterium]|nr:ATPase [bacterium]